MKVFCGKISIIVICLFICVKLFSQQGYKVPYKTLKEYEGKYEYLNHASLKIAASPKDTLLYAIINQTRYALTGYGRDIFLDAAKNKLSFVRNTSNHITGYVLNNTSFKQLSKKVSMPKDMWYPRLNGVVKITAPKKLKDGLQIGKLAASGLDTALLALMTRKIANGDYPNVHSVLVIKDGKLVFEEYFYEYDRNTLQEMRSATKSVVSALTGIALEDGFIKSKSDKVLSYFPEYTIANNSDLKKQITIENLLTNQSGLDCDISNEKSAGNETKMDYSEDWVKFTLDLPMIDKPGEKGMYCSGNPITLGRIIEKATHIPLAEFAKKKLFAPLGIKKFKWNFKPDKSNAEDYCQLYLTPREMAKFGLMYLDDGMWTGKQIVPADWVQQSFARHSVVQNIDYGYLWWIKYLDAGGKRYYGRAAQGNGGQKIYIWKEQNMVTVVTGGNYNSQSPSDELISKYILPAFNKN